MSITKITIEEWKWIDGVRFMKERAISAEDVKGDFDDYILAEIPSSTARDFAEENFDLIKKSQCPVLDIEDFDTEELIEELESQGYQVIKCETLNDTFKLDQLKEQMHIS